MLRQPNSATQRSDRQTQAPASPVIPEITVNDYIERLQEIAHSKIGNLLLERSTRLVDLVIAETARKIANQAGSLSIFTDDKLAWDHIKDELEAAKKFIEVALNNNSRPKEPKPNPKPETKTVKVQVTVDLKLLANSANKVPTESLLDQVLQNSFSTSHEHEAKIAICEELLGRKDLNFKGRSRTLLTLTFSYRKTGRYRDALMTAKELVACQERNDEDPKFLRRSRKLAKEIEALTILEEPKEEVQAVAKNPEAGTETKIEPESINPQLRQLEAWLTSIIEESKDWPNKGSKRKIPQSRQDALINQATSKIDPYLTDILEVTKNCNGFGEQINALKSQLTKGIFKPGLAIAIIENIAKVLN